jgi:hypothetical protein
MGSAGFLITYFAAGIFGYVDLLIQLYWLFAQWFVRNVLGGNFSLVGVPSVGASGAIFGTVAVRTSLYPVNTMSFSKTALQVAWVDLIAHWKYQYQPVRKVRR